MNVVEKERWLLLAQSLATTAYPDIDSQTKARLCHDIQDFIELLSRRERLENIRGWNEGPSYPSLALQSYVVMRGYMREPIHLVSAMQACLSAGFDLAVRPNGGPLGFSMGDLRRVFPGGLPAWVARALGEDNPDRLSDAHRPWTERPVYQHAS